MTVIYIDTEKLEKPIPPFGIICSGLREEKHSMKVEAFKHPINDKNSFNTDACKILPITKQYSFFIADNPQNWREQIEFIGSVEFWQGLGVEYGRVYEELTLKDSGLRAGLENSFSSFIYQTLKDMRGYSVIVNDSTGETKNMLMLDVEAVRSQAARGISFSVTLEEISRATKETTELEIERVYKPKKSDTETGIKTDPEKKVGKLNETNESLLVSGGAPGATGQ